ncbi:MAG TPA: MBL fold metallo-hydrolase [Longimicrobiaceae bacterium]|nr:MBL fold metallo-hydrolase [Longimicrobiaceae bacterium]
MRTRAWLVSLLLLHPATAAAQVDQLTKVETVRLADGVYAALRGTRPDQPANANSLIIINCDDVVVVDASLTPTSTRGVIAEIRKLTSKPVRYVINTHWHDDHHFGNQAYLEEFPGVEFIAHASTRKDIRERAMPALARNRTEYPRTLAGLEATLACGRQEDGAPLTAEQRESTTRYAASLRAFIPEMQRTEMVLPGITLERELVLHRCDREIRVLYLGRGNTRGDVVVHLPRERILATGDLVVSPIPFAFGSYPGEWVETLARLRALDAEVIVPGHGAVLRNGEYVETLDGLLDSVLEQTRDAVQRGLSLEETRKIVDLEPFRARLAGDDPLLEGAFTTFFAVPAVERAYLEARGELHDP